VAEKVINKVIYGGKVLIDLTQDTITAATLLSGAKAHGADGNVITGTCDYDVNSADATASASEILSGKTAAVKGAIVTGTMKNNGAVEASLSSLTEAYIIPLGYHDGSGKVTISATEQAKLIASNIRENVTILGVTGTMSGTEDVNAQAKEVTPATTAQEILPDTGYNYLSQVTVAAIPYSEVENTQGGLTATIAG